MSRDNKKNSIPQLDLHGMTVSEAIDRLEIWLSSAVMRRTERASVVHGIGTGKVMNAVHQRLRELSVVRTFKLNQSNPGMTDVYL